MSRPELNPREARLLQALQLLKSWVVHYTEPSISGRGEQYICLKRDMSIAEQAIKEATNGNES